MQLTRSEMKNVLGGMMEPGPGDACSYTWQDSSGWHTESGTCHVAVSMNGNGPNSSTTYTPFCNTPSHTSPTALSSNGGASRCGQQFTA